MRIEMLDLADAFLMRPSPFRDNRGFFTRTFDAEVFDTVATGTRAADFVQDSQSRSSHGTVRGMHGRSASGEAKLVRCAHGAILDVIVDFRPESPTYLRHAAVRLDDVDFLTLYVPRGFLHGFQTLTDTADVCYRIDAPHDPAENISVRYDDPDLAIAWPLPIEQMSTSDLSAPRLRDILGDRP